MKIKLLKVTQSFILNGALKHILFLRRTRVESSSNTRINNDFLFLNQQP